jgi:hypothetical protein
VPDAWRGSLGPPVAKIEQTGRWVRVIWISDGLSRYGPDGYGWHRLGERRAVKKAERESRRYLRREERSRNALTVGVPDA